MNLDLSGNQFQNIAAVVGAIVALALTLQTATGPTVMYLTEALKAAFPNQSGKGGLYAIGVSCTLGAGLGIITAIVTGASGSGYVGFLAIGLFVGLFMAAGAVNSHKAAATVNTTASADIETGNTFREESNKHPGWDIGKPVVWGGLASAEPEPEEGDTDSVDDLESIIQSGPPAVEIPEAETEKATQKDPTAERIISIPVISPAASSSLHTIN